MTATSPILRYEIAVFICTIAIDETLKFLIKIGRFYTTFVFSISVSNETN